MLAHYAHVSPMAYPRGGRYPPPPLQIPKIRCQRWPTVYDAGPSVKQHYFNISCLLTITLIPLYDELLCIYSKRDALAKRWDDVGSSSTTLVQHQPNIRPAYRACWILVWSCHFTYCHISLLSCLGLATQTCPYYLVKLSLSDNLSIVIRIKLTYIAQNFTNRG